MSYVGKLRNMTREGKEIQSFHYCCGKELTKGIES